MDILTASDDDDHEKKELRATLASNESEYLAKIEVDLVAVSAESAAARAAAEAARDEVQKIFEDVDGLRAAQQGQ